MQLINSSYAEAAVIELHFDFLDKRIRLVIDDDVRQQRLLLTFDSSSFFSVTYAAFDEPDDADLANLNLKGLEHYVGQDQKHYYILHFADESVLRIEAEQLTSENISGYGTLKSIL